MKSIKTNSKRWIALSALGAMTLGGTVATTTPAQAKSSTWKKIAIGGAAVTGYGLLKHNGKAQTIGAIVAGGSYLKYRHDKKNENSQRQAWYRQRYGNNWRNHYRTDR